MIKEIFNKQKKESIIISSVVIALIIILIGIFFWAKNASGKEELIEEVTAETEQTIINPFEDVRLSARSAIVKDISTGKILYEKNPDEILPLASITKVLTAITALDILEEDSLVQIKQENLSVGNDSALIVGSYFRLKDILKLMLVASSNSASMAIASNAGDKINPNSSGSISYFMEKMNSIASKIGMENSSFKNPSGLDENNETVASAKGTARDVSRLFEYVLKNHQDILEATREDYLSIRTKDGHEHQVVNTNTTVGELPNVIGSKTGFTDLAGGNLAVVIDPGLNTPVVIVVLGSSKEGRFKDVERLSNATLDYLLLKK